MIFCIRDHIQYFNNTFLQALKIVHWVQGYQFWTNGRVLHSCGSFTIGNVRAGVYNLYAWVPGVVGEKRREETVLVCEIVCVTT
jgi:hypothetical protein